MWKGAAPGCGVLFATAADRKGNARIMRFIHIADVHLGAKPEAGKAYSGRRPEELWNTFGYIIRLCEKERTDLLLIAGDLFHRQPLLRELKEVDYLFSTLSHTKVVLIAGNHDYIRNDSYYRTFKWSGNVYPLFGKEMECVEFEELHTAVYGLSYYAKEVREPLYNNAVEKGMPDGRQKYEILLAHGGDERHIPIDWKKLEASRFAYVALGHIHKPDAVRKNRIVYSGAPEPVDRGDTGLHGYITGVITEDGVRAVRVCCAVREYIPLDIPVCENDTCGSVREKIKKLKKKYGNNNIYTLTLKGTRDPHIIFDEKQLAGGDEAGNIIAVEDRTCPAYDFGRLYRENEDNLIGKYIKRFSGCEEGSEEYQALCEGVNALLENRR